VHHVEPHEDGEPGHGFSRGSDSSPEGLGDRHDEFALQPTCQRPADLFAPRRVKEDARGIEAGGDGGTTSRGVLRVARSTERVWAGVDRDAETCTAPKGALFMYRCFKMTEESGKCFSAIGRDRM
jgi:hypothetical protein